MPDLEDVAAERVDAVLWPQGELLGLPPVPVSRGEVAARVERRAKAGRPPGARNRRAEDIARLIDERFGDARLHQAAIATMDVEELAARLGCSPLEAAQEKRLAFVAVAPFLYQRQPQQVDLRNHAAVSLTINLGHPGEAGAASATIEATAVDIEQFQYVSGGDDGQV